MKNGASQEEDYSTKQQQFDEKTYIFIIFRRALLEERLTVAREDECVEQLRLRLRRE
jgi:hypothetical protein